MAFIYAGLIIWLYTNEPKTFGEVATKATVSVGTYEIDQDKFEEGLRLFRTEIIRQPVIFSFRLIPRNAIQMFSFIWLTVFTGRVSAKFITMMRFLNKVWSNSITLTRPSNLPIRI